MKIFLIIVAAIVVGLPLAALLAVVVLKWYIGRKFKSVGSSLEKAMAQIAAMAGSPMPGMKLELTPAEQTPWHHPAEVAEAIDLLTANGFVEIDRYLVDGSNDIITGLYHHPSEHAAVALYDLKQSPPKMDVTASYGGGERFVFYTNVKHDGLDKPPYTTYERLPDLDNTALLAAAKSGLPAEGRDPIDPAAMASVVQKVYEREQMWRVNRGGYTEEEIISTLKAAGEAITKDTIETSRSLMNAALAEDLEEMLRERFLETTDYSASEWEEIEDRFLVIHPLVGAEELSENLSLVYPGDVSDRTLEKLDAEIDKRLAAGENPIDLFAEMATQAPRFDELKKLGETTEPVTAVYYAHPPYRDEDDD